MTINKPTAARDLNPARTKRFNLTLGKRRIITGYLLFLPVLLWKSVELLYPFIRTIYLSMTNTNILKGTNAFAGLENYRLIFTNKDYAVALQFTLFFTFASVVIQLVLAMVVAEILNRKFFLRNLVRAVNLLPWAMPGIVTAVMATWAFNTDYGMVPDIIWRLTGLRPALLSDPWLARWSVILVDVWKNTPFLAVVFLSGKQGISPELYEAAEMDGASPWDKFTKITLPLLTPLIIIMTVFVAAYRILTFDLVYGMTGGGPGAATSLISFWAYVTAFTNLAFGYSSAMAITLFLGILLLGLVGVYFIRRAWAKYY